MDQSPPQSPRYIYILLAAAVIVNFSGLFVTIMGPDAALYASISKTMVLKHDYMNLYRDNLDWLDKPHFPFWITALSFELFGFTTWAYKLPGILFMLVGAWYTYKFAKKLYNEEIALWASLILLTAQHIILSNNDVRAEPYLTGLVIASVYHFYLAYNKRIFWQLVIACLMAACAVMTKGIFALIPIGGAIAGELYVKRDWKNLFNVRWLIAGALILVFITPELFALYRQFDMHPEKVVFEHTNVSGIRFFFWDSQFGRFFNNGPIKGEGDPTFFIHTTLWAFLPWSLILFAAIFSFIKNNYKKPGKAEWFCISGALLTFLLFSASRFQLPHYLNIVFPFFAILTAQYISRLRTEKGVKLLSTTQYVLTGILLLLLPVLHNFFSPGNNLLAIVILLSIPAAFLLLNKVPAMDKKERMVAVSAIVAIGINLYLNLVFYPSLMHYQSGSIAAKWINDNNKQHLPVVAMQPSYPLEFYLHQPVTISYIDKEYDIKPSLAYINEEERSKLESRGLKVQVLKTLDHFLVAQMNGSFINKKTRASAISSMYVAIVSN